jgi:hypothetical protein
MAEGVGEGKGVRSRREAAWDGAVGRSGATSRCRSATARPPTPTGDAGRGAPRRCSGPAPAGMLNGVRGTVLPGSHAAPAAPWLRSRARLPAAATRRLQLAHSPSAARSLAAAPACLPRLPGESKRGGGARPGRGAIAIALAVSKGRGRAPRAQRDGAGARAAPRTPDPLSLYLKVFTPRSYSLRVRNMVEAESVGEMARGELATGRGDGARLPRASMRVAARLCRRRLTMRQRQTCC